MAVHQQDDLSVGRHQTSIHLFSQHQYSTLASHQYQASQVSSGRLPSRLLVSPSSQPAKPKSDDEQASVDVQRDESGLSRHRRSKREVQLSDLATLRTQIERHVLTRELVPIAPLLLAQTLAVGVQE